MFGSRLATVVLPPPPPAPANKTTGNIGTRDPVTSPPLPVPDRIARGQPPPRLAATFLSDGNPRRSRLVNLGDKLCLLTRPPHRHARVIAPVDDGLYL